MIKSRNRNPRPSSPVSDPLRTFLVQRPGQFQLTLKRRAPNCHVLSLSHPAQQNGLAGETLRVGGKDLRQFAFAGDFLQFGTCEERNEHYKHNRGPLFARREMAGALATVEVRRFRKTRIGGPDPVPRIFPWRQRSGARRQPPDRMDRNNRCLDGYFQALGSGRGVGLPPWASTDPNRNGAGRRKKRWGA